MASSIRTTTGCGRRAERRAAAAVTSVLWVSGARLVGKHRIVRRVLGTNQEISWVTRGFRVDPLRTSDFGAHTVLTPGTQHPPDAESEAARPSVKRPSQGAPSGELSGGGDQPARGDRHTARCGPGGWLATCGAFGRRRWAGTGLSDTARVPASGSSGRRPERRGGSGLPVTRGFVASADLSTGQGDAADDQLASNGCAGRSPALT